MTNLGTICMGDPDMENAVVKKAPEGFLGIFDQLRKDAEEYFKCVGREPRRSTPLTQGQESGEMEYLRFRSYR